MIDEFIARWEPSGASERANGSMFLNELCDQHGVGRPDPDGGTLAKMRTRCDLGSIGFPNGFTASLRNDSGTFKIKVSDTRRNCNG